MTVNLHSVVPACTSQRVRADNGAVSGLKEELMTTPQQPDADSPDEAEEIEDLLAPAETQQQVAGGMMDDCCATHEGSEGGGRG